MVALVLFKLSPATPIADCFGYSETLQNFGWFQPDRIKGYDNESLWFSHQLMLPTRFLIITLCSMEHSCNHGRIHGVLQRTTPRFASSMRVSIYPSKVVFSCLKSDGLIKLFLCIGKLKI